MKPYLGFLNFQAHAQSRPCAADTVTPGEQARGEASDLEVGSIDYESSLLLNCDGSRGGRLGVVVVMLMLRRCT